MTPYRFQPFGHEHQLLLVVFVVGCVGFGLLGHRVRDTPVQARVQRTLAIVLPVFCVPLQVLQLLPGDFDKGTSLPLQVCDLSWMLATYALFTGNRRACQLLYYWGLVLVTQAIITPSLDQEFPDPRWFMFWGMHFFTVWAAVFLTWGGPARPSWDGLRFSVLVTLGWVAAVMVFNEVAGTDYGYFNGKPRVHSLLDLLGPWPVYVVAEIAIALVVWVLITLPWVRSRGISGPKETVGHLSAS